MTTNDHAQEKLIDRLRSDYDCEMKRADAAEDLVAELRVQLSAATARAEADEAAYAKMLDIVNRHERMARMMLTTIAQLEAELAASNGRWVAGSYGPPLPSDAQPPEAS